MKKTLKIALSLILTLTIVLSLSVIGFADPATSSPFASDAYATIITASDFQGDSPAPFERFAKILTLMKNDGLGTPQSVLSGGDYSKMWPDYATPGVMQVKDAYASVYPDANTDAVVCVQGNHDFLSAGFTKTGMYDMGAYNLYAINENDFPWNEFLRLPNHVESTAKNLESALKKLIADGDKRPVIILTHLPLHHTDRTFYGDNMYSGYIFDVLNEAAKSLDIIFLFGHNHSGDYDDYIGGSVNFLAPGEKIRVPMKDKKGEDCYTEETLNFTYANCGYVGYSGNGTENGSTNLLTAGAIQFTKEKICFYKYSESGLFKSYDVERKCQNTDVSSTTTKITTTLVNSALYDFMVSIFRFFSNLFVKNAVA